MKKLVFMFVAFAAISFASCGNKTDNAAVANDSDSVATVVEEDSLAADSASTDSVDSTTVAPEA